MFVYKDYGGKYIIMMMHVAIFPQFLQRLYNNIVAKLRGIKL